MAKSLTGARANLWPSQLNKPREHTRVGEPGAQKGLRAARRAVQQEDGVGDAAGVVAHRRAERQVVQGERVERLAAAELEVLQDDGAALRLRR